MSATRIEGATDQLIVMHNVSWAQYAVITEAIGDSGALRTTYLEGELNILSPGRAHEFVKKLLARLIEAFAEEREIALNGFGNETLRREWKEAGLEPDECYSVGHAREIPDLAVEIVTTHGTIDKLQVYLRLGCPEVWFWEEGKLQVHGLRRGAYAKRRTSRFLPGFPFHEVEQLIARTDPAKQTEAVRAFRRAL